MLHVDDAFGVDLNELKPNHDRVTKFADRLTENFINARAAYVCVCQERTQEFFMGWGSKVFILSVL
jgi:hypothetical protein